MVSSSIVSKVSYDANTKINLYKTTVNSLSASWKGTSASSIISKVDTIDKYATSISSSASSFASACDKYEKYIRLKKEIEKLENDLVDAKKRLNSIENNSKLSPNYATILYAAQNHVKGLTNTIEKDNKELEKLKKEIEDLLEKAKSAASKVAKTMTKKSNKAAATPNLEKINNVSAANNALVSSLEGEIGNTMTAYYGNGFHSGQWCADFVSYMLAKNGYDIEKSSLAGDGDGTILGNARKAGYDVHLDKGSQSMSWANQSEYDPNYSPKAGDIVVFNWDNDNDNDHTGFVVKDNGDGTITTIEGNTSSLDGSKSSCVERKVRARSEIYGYATPVKNVSSSDDDE